MSDTALTQKQLQEYASLLKGDEAKAQQDDSIVRHTCALLNFFASRTDDLQHRAPITKSFKDEAVRIIQEQVLNGNAVKIVFEHLLLRARELALRSGIHDRGVLLAFQYVEKAYINSDEQPNLYELYKFEVQKELLREFLEDVRNERIAIQKLISAWTATIDSSKNEVDLLQAQLDSQHKQYNFVGLSQAFSDLLQKKKHERLWMVVFCVGLSLSLIAVPFSVSWLGALIFGYSAILSDIVKIGDITNKVIIAMPFIAIEIVLIYIFRVLLNNYYNVKSQVVQLELRGALCQFVEGYIDFAKKIGPVSISKFESLIYSELERPASNVTGPFDPEALAKLIEAARK